MLRLARRRACIDHVFASAAERFLLRQLDPKSTILTVAKSPLALSSLESNLPNLRRLRYVVTESERDRELLRQGGVPDEALVLIYPGAVPRPYRPADDPFTILFATSPLGAYSLLERGIRLIVQAARQLPEIRFLLIWREYHLPELELLLEQAGVRNVQVRSGLIGDMGAVYDSVHATILPGMEYGSLKPSPQSALNSLGHGKPVLSSRPTSISTIIERHRCGVVFDPDMQSLIRAIRELRENYDLYQTNCHPTVRGQFSQRVFLERYRALYESML